MESSKFFILFLAVIANLQWSCDFVDAGKSGDKYSAEANKPLGGDLSHLNIFKTEGVNRVWRKAHRVSHKNLLLLRSTERLCQVVYRYQLLWWESQSRPRV